ncbi:uncharacterized protein [Nicotiana sylvestris]|uniref:uncharacterized protein n=1 Tax=Nicotiana sylvestris TaxID=4096 RepID=UPI00388C5149
MTLTQYEMRFSELARHAIWMIPSDRGRIRRFVDGFNYHLRILMTRERVLGATFEEVVDIAREIEMLDDDLTFDVEPVAILGRQVQKLRSKDITSVKVQWRGQPMKEVTWETEQEMQSKYPHLFEASDTMRHGGAKQVNVGDGSVLRMEGCVCVPNADGFCELILDKAHSSRYQPSIQVGPYEALYKRQYRSPVGCFELGEAQLLGTDLVPNALDKVRDVAFIVGEKVFLWVSPMKGVMSFGKKGKLNPRYIVPFEILERVGEVAYRYALPPSLSAVHLVFHVSMLRKYYNDPYHVLDFSSVQLDKDLTYEEEPVEILARQVRQLRSRSYPSVRVQWRSQPIEAAT